MELDLTGNFEKLYKVHISELPHCKTEGAGIFIHPFPLVMDFEPWVRGVNCPVLPAC